MNPIRTISALVLLSALAACEPRERAEWSPDGKHAALLTGQGLRFTDASGVLSSPLPDHDREPGVLKVESFSWLPDSSGLVAHRVRLAPDWSSAKALLPVTEAVRVENLAARVPDMFRATTVLYGDADRGVDSLLAKIAPGEGLALVHALNLAFAEDPAAVRAALADVPEALASLNRRSREARSFAIHEIAIVPRDPEAENRILWRGLRGIHSLRTSPRHPFVACTRETNASGRYELVLISLDGSAPEFVAADNARAFDWTPDGRSLVFLANVSPESNDIFLIRRLRVLNEAGTQPVSGEIDGAEDLAYAFLPFTARIAVLPDGAVLFACMPGALPAPAEPPAESSRLYRIPAQGGPPVAIPTAQGALPMDLGYYAPSPDGRRVAVIEGGTDALALVDLKTGESELVSPPNPGWRSRLLPSWRNANEFTFAAVDPESRRVRWMRWKDGKTADLSAAWSAEVAGDWLAFIEPTP